MKNNSENVLAWKLHYNYQWFPDKQAEAFQKFLFELVHKFYRQIYNTETGTKSAIYVARNLDGETNIVQQTVTPSENNASLHEPYEISNGIHYHADFLDAPPLEYEEHSITWSK